MKMVRCLWEKKKERGKGKIKLKVNLKKREVGKAAY
jgi:hypothetical protein